MKATWDWETEKVQSTSNSPWLCSLTSPRSSVTYDLFIYLRFEMCFLNWFHLHFNNTLACNKLAQFSKFHNAQPTNHRFLFPATPPSSCRFPLCSPWLNWIIKRCWCSCIRGLLYFLLHIFSLHFPMIYLWHRYAYKIYTAPKITLQWPKLQSWKSSVGWFTSESLPAKCPPLLRSESPVSGRLFAAEQRTVQSLPLTRWCVPSQRETFQTLRSKEVHIFLVGT